MQLKVGDRLTDETGEYEVVGRPYTTAGGKTGSATVGDDACTRGLPPSVTADADPI
jgi:hypothetical protein